MGTGNFSRLIDHFWDSQKISRNRSGTVTVDLCPVTNRGVLIMSSVESDARLVCFSRTPANQFNQFRPIKSVGVRKRRKKSLLMRSFLFFVFEIVNRRPRDVAKGLSHTAIDREKCLALTILFAQPFDHFSWRTEWSLLERMGITNSVISLPVPGFASELMKSGKGK